MLMGHILDLNSERNSNFEQSNELNVFFTLDIQVYVYNYQKLIL